jgi:integrase
MAQSSTREVLSAEEDLEYVSSASKEYLNYREAITYNDYRRSFITWLETQGKEPDKETGYHDSTVTNYAHRQDKFYRWVWDRSGYTLQITHGHADDYMNQFAKDKLRKDNGDSYSGNHKRKTANAIESLFSWRAHEHGGERWSPEVSFSEKTLNKADAFTRTERQQLREVALEYGSIPKYNDLSPEERDRWKAYLAQKLGKPKQEVSPDDWRQVNRSWKIPSLVLVALDGGFRPVGIHRADTSWFRPKKGVLAVPTEDVVKDGEQPEVALTDQTVSTLNRWLTERQNYPEYDDTDALWLNRKGNRYNSDTLNYLLDNLCEEAGISRTNRNISWYSIRHSVGTYLVSEGNLSEAQAQLRHKNPETTMRYASPPPEERRDSLNKI